MGRRRRGRRIDGWLNLDKPAGMTSAEAVDEVKKLTKPQKAGHAGTLDPLATGVLAIAFGQATKTVPYLMGAPKHYRFKVRFGEERDTDDAEGKVTSSSEDRPDRAAIEGALPAFVGDIEQVPPTYAALKIGGERAYDLARRGEAPVLEARPVHVDSLALVGDAEEDEAELELVCGKGTYVRAIARDLGRALGCYGYVCALRRTRLGPFAAEDALSLEQLAEAEERRALFDHLHPVATALSAFPTVELDVDEAEALSSGQQVHVGGAIDEPGPVEVRVMVGDRLVAVGSYAHGVVRPVRVFN
jgi:tRNA pseudouridine55 synthase